MTVSTKSDWQGVPNFSTPGWAWLRHRKKGYARIAYWGRGHWYVSDAMGRTIRRSEALVARLFTYIKAAT